MSRRLALSALAGALGGALFGYDIGAISSATQGLRAYFVLSPSTLGVAVSAALFGTIAGALTAGFTADTFGRRRVLRAANALYILATLGAGCSFSFAQFVLFRMIGGIAIGLISVVAPMYLAEIAPTHLRGRLVGSFQMSIGIGVVLAFASGFLISRQCVPGEAWRWSLALGAIPGALGCLLLFRAVPSPRWLALKRRFAEARCVLLALGELDTEQARLVTPAEAPECSPETTLFSRRYARPIFLAVSVAAFNQLTGVNVLLYYILDVVADLGSGHLDGRKAALLIAAMSLVVTALAVSVIDKVGRKPLLLAGSAGMALCLVLLPAQRYMRWPAVSVIVVLVCYNAFFAFSQGTVVWVYLSELFPLPVRARGQSLGSTVNWLANALITGSFPLLASGFGARIFIIFAALMALQFFVVLLLYPETKHINLETLASDISR